MIERRITGSIEVKQRLLADKELIATIQHAVDLLVDCFKNGHKVWLCGNGGSAADAQHIAAELSGRFYLNRPPLPAESFTVNTSYITAVSNDFSFDDIFSRMTQAQCNRGDILIGFSTSGNSKNVANAFSEARNKNVHTIALTGSGGGKLKELSDVLIAVPDTDTPRIQECHILIGHIICELVESSIFGNVS